MSELQFIPENEVLSPTEIGAAYDTVSEWFSGAAAVEHGRKYLDMFMPSMKPDGHVLDLGCGAGRWGGILLANGFTLTGVDVSAKLLDIARRRYPQGEWVLADASAFPAGQLYDGVICWDSLFHLPHSQLEPILRKFQNLIRPGGILLYTGGDVDGSIEGEMQGVRFTYSALDQKMTCHILAETGFEIICCEHDQPNEHHLVILARRQNS